MGLSVRVGLVGTLRLLLVLTMAAASMLVLQSPGHAAEGQRRVSIIFAKNWQNQFRSQVIWQVQQRRPDGSWATVDQAAWRAGSGLADRWGKNSCVRNHGWTPSGTYSFVQSDHYDGRYINGRVFRLQDKRCPNGTVRRNMFIHSEQTPANTQCPDGPGDQSCRWEWPAVNDYRSHGCIKMAPGDLQALTARYHRFFRSGVRYPVSTVRVVVR